MILADTCVWIDFFSGKQNANTQVLKKALQSRQLWMQPIVLVETSSEAKFPDESAGLLSALPLLEFHPGYWERAARTRGSLLASRRKARLGDSLIAQSCLDHGITLLTSDKDFRSFQEIVGLQVMDFS